MPARPPQPMCARRATPRAFSLQGDVCRNGTLQTPATPPRLTFPDPPIPLSPPMCANPTLASPAARAHGRPAGNGQLWRRGRWRPRPIWAPKGRQAAQEPVHDVRYHADGAAAGRDCRVGARCAHGGVRGLRRAQKREGLTFLGAMRRLILVPHAEFEWPTTLAGAAGCPKEGRGYAHGFMHVEAAYWVELSSLVFAHVRSRVSFCKYISSTLCSCCVFPSPKMLKKTAKSICVPGDRANPCFLSVLQ